MIKEVTISGTFKLCGNIYYPTGYMKGLNYPAICIAPGGRGVVKTAGPDDCGYALVEIANSLSECGFITLLFNWRGRGIPPRKSEGTRENQPDLIEDLISALNFLCREESVDSKRIGLFGECVGGAAGLLVAKDDERVKSIVIYGTSPSYSKCKADGRLDSELQKLWVEMGKSKSFADYVQNFKTIDMIDVIPQIKQPLLIMGGTDDEKFFRQDEQDEILKKVTNSQIVMYLKIKGMAHRLRHFLPSFQVLLNFIISWFKLTL